MSILLLPLSGAFLIIRLVALVLIIAGLVSVVTYRSEAFTAAGKQPKLIWVGLLALGFIITFIGVIAALVYFLDVRPALQTVGGGRGPGRSGGSSSDGPYGPFRG
jgi:predicted MFS family arabinose efflux permease